MIDGYGNKSNFNLYFKINEHLTVDEEGYLLRTSESLILGTEPGEGKSESISNLQNKPTTFTVGMNMLLNDKGMEELILLYTKKDNKK